MRKLQLIAEDLKETARAGRHSLVVSGSNDLGEQLITIRINEMLNNFGVTIDTTRACYLKQGDDRSLQRFAQEVEAGTVDAVIFIEDANPVYDTPYGKDLADAMAKIPTKIALQLVPNETAHLCNIVAPIHHSLESWSDAQPYAGHVAFIQPTIAPLYDTRSADVSLQIWSGQTFDESEDRADYQLVRNQWNLSDHAWEQALSDGFLKTSQSSSAGKRNIAAVSADVAIAQLQNRQTADSEVKFYETINIGAGQFGNNPWLQELPDPIYRTVWDNFVTIPVKWDGNRTISGMNGWKSGDLVKVSIGGKEVTVPVVDQFGVISGAHGMAIGYGRTNAGPTASGVGVSAAPYFHVNANGYVQYYAPIVFGDKVGHDQEFASVQYHHTYGIKDTDPETGETINIDEKSISTIAAGYQGALTDRSVLYYTDVTELDTAVDDLKHFREHAQHLNEQTLYPSYENLYANGHKWEMSVDLSSCIGCGSCQVACIAENNVPIVGKKEVSRHHEMTWLRIDRYFFGDMESPNTAYQPMMCQHCDNAPCENVCPVGATQHSSEGLNHMTYNRCIGTRYCANNCPYKVRRFNWLDYTTADLFGSNENNPLPNQTEVPFYADNMTRMVLNPDVTVRTRGVIEKCSFCIQRIQAGKLNAKAENRPLRDGEVNVACATACPTGCIEFGDINDTQSKVAKLEKSPLNYYVLEETNTRSGVGYLMKVTNKNQKISALDA